MPYKSILVFLITFLLSACSQNSSSNQTSYYQFYGENSNLEVLNSVDKPMLVISEVKLPGSLNNRGIAMRVNKHQFQNANWHLWSTSPDEMLLTHAESNLVSLETNWLFLTQRGPINQLKNNVYYEVKWHLNQFNGGLNNNAEISGLWQLYRHHNNGTISMVKQQYFTEKQTLKTDGYTGLVSALETLWMKVNKDFIFSIENI